MLGLAIHFSSVTERTRVLLLVNNLSFCSLFLFEHKQALEEGVKVDLGVGIASLPRIHHVLQGVVCCRDAGCHL